MTDYRSMFDLSGKTAIVTGGAGILGQHFCAALASFGARVAVVDLDAAAAARQAQALAEEHGVATLGLGCDVADPAAVAAMVEAVSGTLSGIDILLNNAASKSSSLDAFFAPTEEFALKTWREVMAVNLDGLFLVAQAVGRQMVAQGRGGSIIQTGSIYGVTAPDQRIYEGSEYLGRPINTPAVYSASKAGVVGLSRYLATYWGERGIRVNTLVPGGVQSGQNDVFHRRYAARVPLGRMAAARDMVGAVVFLASDASAYVTGQELVVDGGLSAW